MYAFGTDILGVFQLQTSSGRRVVAELRVLDIQEIRFGRSRASVPGARVIAPLDASVVFGLLTADRLLDHPVRPQALCWAGDHAGDGGAACNLAFTAHIVALGQALLLGGAHFLPWLDEVTECDVH